MVQSTASDRAKSNVAVPWNTLVLGSSLVLCMPRHARSSLGSDLHGKVKEMVVDSCRLVHLSQLAEAGLENADGRGFGS